MARPFQTKIMPDQLQTNFMPDQLQTNFMRDHSRPILCETIPDQNHARPFQTNFMRGLVRLRLFQTKICGPPPIFDSIKFKINIGVSLNKRLKRKKEIFEILKLSIQKI